MSAVTGRPAAGSDSRLTSLTSLPGKPALVVVDVQNDFGNPADIAHYGLGDVDLARVESAVDTMEELVNTARDLGIGIVWVELGSDPEHPWRSSNWLRTGEYDAPMAADEPCRIGTKGADWYRLRPRAFEPRVVKATYSGFLRTDLDEVLCSLDTSWLTVVGLTTECCVFATAQDAMQHDWRVVVPADGVAAYDAAADAAALNMLSINIAAISDAAEVAGLWKEWAA